MANDMNVASINWSIKANASEATKELKNLSSGVSNLNKLFGLFKVSAFIGALKSIGNLASKLATKQSEYIQTLNLFNKTMGSSISKAEEFRDAMQDKLGFDPSQIMSSMTTLKRLTDSFGIAEEDSYKMSQNLTQLAADMTAYGYSFDNAMQKLKSGLSGKIFCLVYKGLYTVTHLIAGKSKRVMA